MLEMQEHDQTPAMDGKSAGNAGAIFSTKRINLNRIIAKMRGYAK